MAPVSMQYILKLASANNGLLKLPDFVLSFFLFIHFETLPSSNTKKTNRALKGGVLGSRDPNFKEGEIPSNRD